MLDRRSVILGVGAAVLTPRVARASSADDTFMQVANAAAKTYPQCPPYVTYRVHGTFKVMGEAPFDRVVSVRTADAVAVVHDEAKNKDELKAPFPAAPNFDALSTFVPHGLFSYSVGSKGKSRDIDFRIANVNPLQYRTDIDAHVDSIARAVKGYVVKRADDDASGLAHLTLSPVSDATRGADYHLTDVLYDKQSLLPIRVTWNGPSKRFLEATYTLVDGHWLLLGMRFNQKVGMVLGSVSVAFDASFADYTFSDTAPDPRLEPKPA